MSPGAVLWRLAGRTPVRALLATVILGGAVQAGSVWATPPTPIPYEADISDLESIRRRYYFVADHAVAIQEGSLRVWRDDAIPSNNIGSMPGVARLDPLLPPGSTNPEVMGNFDLLRPGVDYTLLERWTDLGSGPVSVPVIQLTRSLTAVEILAVTYVDETSDPPVAVGSAEPDTLLARAVAVRSPDHQVGNDGMFDPDAPWYPLLSYEMRHMYDLGARDIPMERLRIKIRRIGELAFGVFGKSYLQHLGLDREGGPGSGSADPDGLVDAAFVDPVEGILTFPDHHPFDPGPVSAGCPEGRGGFLCLDDLERNILRRDHDDVLARANPSAYFDPNPNLSEDTEYFLTITILPPPEPGALLHQNAPNPFNPETTIRFDLNTSERVRVTILDVHGRVVSRLLDATLPDGPHQVSWSGKDESGKSVASGVYVCRLETPSTDVSRKMVLAR